MPIELLLIVCLVAIFLVPIFFDVNVGIVAFITAFLVGALAMDLSARQVLAGFPDNMFVMLVGITLLLAIAHQNGTVDWIVAKLVRAARGRLVLLPWVLFVTALVTASLGPVAAPVLFVIGVGFVSRYGLNPLMVAAMIIHGTQSGAYSPIAPYGVVIGELAATAGIGYSPVAVYAGVVTFHVLLAAFVFLMLGGRALAGVRVEVAIGETAESERLDRQRTLTLIGFACLVLGLLVYQINLGFLAMSIALVLLLTGPREDRQAAVGNIAWPVVLVIAGVLTYVGLLQHAGATDWLALQAKAMGSPLLMGLVLCFIVAVVTGVASTIGTIGILVPLSAPFVLAGDLEATGLLAAMAVSAAVSDISPYSTWGAMFLATAGQVLNRQEILQAQLKYTIVMVALMPILAWLVFVVPGWQVG
jgi:di/tricarboxylate transporter